MIKTILFTLSLCVVIAAVSDPSSEKVKQKAQETADAAGDYAKEKKDQAIKEFEASSDDLKSKIQKLTDQAKDKNEKVQAQVQAEISHLKAEQKKLELKLEKLKQSSNKAWDHLRDGVQAALDKLNQSYKDAKEDLNK